MVKNIFPPEIADEVATAFVHATGARWSFPRVQIQDQDEEPLVLVSVDTEPSEAQTLELPVRKSIAQALNKVMPTHPDHKFGLWMVVFFSDGKMYETVHPSEFQD
ncbi:MULTISPECIES: hypothetical protein [unclassified Polaromonas]|jgi:hypothetical protein|uniref:hypothetical protein n=1 Tax=unclassified Polaromonas TaxID=2638319 RepID=UPI000F08A01F|nr:MULTISPECIES: hypothetical protein [unclassified Polaromonas]AYQ26885.1 hypothetical protein DT070_01840 [Polaromonas sp. SP1]QGJ18268.1 hypothetical protein F7R28_07595 [Polaromonas sp. Pch-P]